MFNRLLVSGLSSGITSEGLRHVFSPYGEVTAAEVSLDPDTGRSRGFGFVTFADSRAAELAMGKLNGAELHGRTIRVFEAD